MLPGCKLHRAGLRSRTGGRVTNDGQAAPCLPVARVRSSHIGFPDEQTPSLFAKRAGLEVAVMIRGIQQRQIRDFLRRVARARVSRGDHEVVLHRIQ